jgi:glutamate formiminotransferase
LGLLVKGQAQVSMNVVDYRETGLFPVMAALRGEAEKYGVAVTHTELVGLVPQAALVDYALRALQLPATAAEQILEQRLGTATGDFRPVMFE